MTIKKFGQFSQFKKASFFCPVVVAITVCSCSVQSNRPKFYSQLPVLTSLLPASNAAVDTMDEIADGTLAEISSVLAKEGVLRGYSPIFTSDSEIFIAGGFDGSDELSKTWLWDIKKRALTAGPSMTTKRFGPSMSKLEGGQVAISGGKSGTSCLSSIEIYDPVKHSVRPHCEMLIPRFSHSAIQVSRDVLFVSGGHTDEEFASEKDITSSIEVVNIDTKKSTMVGKLSIPRFDHRSFKDNDSIFVAGGKTYWLTKSGLMRNLQTEVCEIARVRKALDKNPR